MSQPLSKNTQAKSISSVSIETMCSNIFSVRNRRNYSNNSHKRNFSLKRMKTMNNTWHHLGVHRVWGVAPITRRKPFRCLWGWDPHSLMRSKKRWTHTCIPLLSMPMNIHCGRVSKSFSPSSGSLFITIRREHKEISNSLKSLENNHPRERSSNRVHYHWYFMYWTVITGATLCMGRQERVRPIQWVS